LTEHNRNEIATFSKWILDVGEGKIPSTAKNGETEKFWIKIPADILPLPEKDHLSCVVQSAYLDLNNMYTNTEYLKQRAILSPTNEAIDALNNYIVSIIPGHTKEYLSCDSVAKGPNTHESYDLMYPVEFLNSISGNNFPQHQLILKKRSSNHVTA